MKINSWVEALFLLDFVWMGRSFGCCYFRFSSWYAWYFYFHCCLVFFFSLLPHSTLPECLVFFFFFLFFSLYFFQWSLLLSNIYIYIYILWSGAYVLRDGKKLDYLVPEPIYILVAHKIHHHTTGWQKLILMGNFWTELMQCILATWLVYSSTWALVTINKLVLVVTKLGA